MNAGERSRQLALLRALGATRRQVAGLLTRQALLLGGLGTLLGLPAGVLLAALLLRVNAAYLEVPLPRLSLSPGALPQAAVLGPPRPRAAALVPAGPAATRPPLAGISLRGGRPPERPATWPPLLGACLLAGVLVFEAGVVQGWISPAVGSSLLPVAASFCLIGCACVLPPFVPTLLTAVARTLRPLLGVEGGLAVRQLLRQRARTGLTVGVLFAAVAVSISFGTTFLNNLRDIRLWFQRTIDADFLIRAVRPDPAVVVTPADLPRGVAEAVRELP